MIQFGNLIQKIDDIVEWVHSTVEHIGDIFADVDFTLLYSWLPSDIAAVITTVIAILLVLAVFGLIKRLLFFLG